MGRLIGRGLALLTLLGLVGCEDRVVYFITLKHGIATVELRAENLWHDGIDCVGAAQCADVLETARKEEEKNAVDGGATLIASGFQLRGNELDQVIRYTIPVEKMTESGQLVPIMVQRPSDVRAGREGVPSLVVLHMASSPTIVELRGPAVRVTGATSGVPGVPELASAVGVEAPDVVMDMLTRGRGRIHVIVPATDNDGKLQHQEPWIQAEPGLADLLKLRGLLLD